MVLQPEAGHCFTEIDDFTAVPASRSYCAMDVWNLLSTSQGQQQGQSYWLSHESTAVFCELHSDISRCCAWSLTPVKHVHEERKGVWQSV